MAQKKSKRIKIIDTSSAATYHTVRIAQRLTLLAAAGLTIWYFATLIAISSSIMIAGSQKDIQFGDSEVLNNTISAMVSTLQRWSISMSVVSLLTTAVLSLLPRVRKFDKKTVIDGVTVAAFLLAVSVTGQTIIRFLLSQL